MADKKFFHVRIDAQALASQVVSVEAEDEEEAKQLALSQTVDHDWEYVHQSADDKSAVVSDVQAE